MNWGLQTVTPAATEPVDLDALKLALRIDDGTDEDADLEIKLAAARETFEEDARRTLVSTTLRLILDRFPRGAGPLALPRPPLVSVSLVRYRAPGTGTWTTIDADDYAVSTSREPGRILPVAGTVWPTVYDQADSVEVEFVAGYGAASAVPKKIKQAILLLAGTWYRQRESVIVGTTGTELPTGYQAIVRQFAPILEYVPFPDER